MYKKIISSVVLLWLAVATFFVVFSFATNTEASPKENLVLAGAKSITQRGTTTVAVYKHAPLDHQAISGAIVEASRMGYDYHSNITTCHADSNFCMTTLVFNR